MCSACGIPTHLVEPEAAAVVEVPPSASGSPTPVLAPVAPARRFAALRNRDCGPYLVGAMLAMMADNVEHVITYWVLWRRFHSTALTGFEVISHWMPFLLLSVWCGGLADRHDCRRVVQAAQGLFMVCSLGWGLLFATHSVTVPAACALLVLHGLAGALWGPGEQLMLQDFVGRADLPSAVRLNATFKSLGVLFGPVVGSALLIGLGPEAGIVVNAAIFLPLTLFLFHTRFTGHTRSGTVPRQRIGLLAALSVVRTVRADRTLISMIVLAGLGSFFIGASLLSSMPVLASAIGGAGAYGALLFAIGAGGVLGGVVLEATGWVRQTVVVALVATAVYAATSLGFALDRGLALGVALLAVGGAANLVAMSVTQTVVQLRAPVAERGRVVGLYGVSASGLRAGSGFTVGLFGAVVGLRVSLTASAAAMALCTALVGVFVLRPARR